MEVHLSQLLLLSQVLEHLELEMVEHQLVAQSAFKSMTL
jgi:hypothetical protein